MIFFKTVWKFLSGFFSEGDGQGSMMRLALYTICLGLIGLCFYIEHNKGWNLYNSGMISTTLIGLFAAKAWQRKQEMKESVAEMEWATKV